MQNGYRTQDRYRRFPALKKVPSDSATVEETAHCRGEHGVRREIRMDEGEQVGRKFPIFWVRFDSSAT